MMRSFAPTLVVLVVLAALVGYYWKWETGEVLKDETVLLQDQEKIESITIKNEKGTIGFKKTKVKDKSEWQIAEPRVVEIDSVRLEDVLKKLASLQAKRVVDEKATDLAQYGIDKPRITVDWTIEGVKKTLQIGKKSNIDQTHYVRVADTARVAMVEGYLLSVFEEDLNAFREKKLLKFDVEKVARIKIASATETRLFKRDDKDREKWAIDQPVSYRADAGAVRNLLYAVNGWQVEEFVADGVKDLAQYGLDKPEKTVQVFLEKDEGTKTLLLGAKKKDDQTKIYCMKEGGDTVATILATSQSEVSKAIEEFRDKKVLELSPSKVKTVAITRGGQSISIERDKGGSWRFLKPLVRKEAHTATDVLVKALEGLRAKGFTCPEKPDLALKIDPAWTTVMLTGEGLTPTTLKIGEVTDKGRHLAIQGDRCAFLPEDDPTSKVDAVVNVHLGLLELDADKVERLEISKGALALAATKDEKKGWQAAKVALGISDVPTKISDLVETLRNLAAQTMEPSSPEKTRESGLDSPDVTVVLGMKGGGRIEIAVGPDRGGLRGVRVPGTDLIARLAPDPLLSKVTALLVAPPKTPSPAPSAGPAPAASGGPAPAGTGVPVPAVVGTAAPAPAPAGTATPAPMPAGSVTPATGAAPGAPSAAPASPQASSAAVPPMPGFTLTTPSVAPLAASPAPTPGK